MKIKSILILLFVFAINFNMSAQKEPNLDIFYKASMVQLVEYAKEEVAKSTSRDQFIRENFGDSNSNVPIPLYELAGEVYDLSKSDKTIDHVIRSTTGKKVEAAANYLKDNKLSPDSYFGQTAKKRCGWLCKILIAILTTVIDLLNNGGL